MRGRSVSEAGFTVLGCELSSHGNKEHIVQDKYEITKDLILTPNISLSM